MKNTEDPRRVVVTGAGILTALGDSPMFVHGALCEGRSGLRRLEDMSQNGMRSPQAGELKWFDAGKYLAGGNLRPLDRTSRLGATVAKLALEAGGWAPEMLADLEAGLVLGTMFGSIHTISEFDRRAVVAGPNYAKPMDFANSVINAAAGQMAIWHNLRGVNATIAGGITSGLEAIAYASDLIRTGRATVLLAGGVDELCFESLYGFHKAGWLCGSNNGGAEYPIPFDARRNGFAVGEGAALLVLEEAGAAAARGARILAEIRGHGNSFDPSRGKDRRRAAAAGARAVRLALADAGLEAAAIDCLSASANGSPATDAHEAVGVGEVFNSAASTLPVTAVKSMLGESLGASGAVQTVLLIEAIRSGLLPGILGLAELEEGFPLAQAGPENRELEMTRGLVNSVGLDGKACSLVVELWQEAG